MSEAKFTKGEWEVEIGCSQAFVATENEFIHESNVDIATVNRNERIANAHLIATAPEMYELLEFISENPSETNVIEIRKLLAKARGEQNEN